MAKQYKKLRQKVHPKQPPAPPKEKVGKDYLLIVVIAFTLAVLILGWGYLDSMNRVMYILLVLSLSLTYIKRHAKLTETQQLITDRASMVSIGLAVAMFLIVLVQQFVQ